MPVFYAELRTQLEDHRKQQRGRASFITRWYRTSNETYHGALQTFSRLIPFIQDTEGVGFRLVQVNEHAPSEQFVIHPMPPDLSEYAPCFYDATNDYDYMVIEGTRLLGIPDDGKSSAYGSYVVNRKTGASSYACANGKFFTHGQILSAFRGLHKRNPAYDPTESFAWHPIIFPYEKEPGEPRINFAYYLASEPILAFPMQFWGHESYDRQIRWLAEQEGLG